MLHQKYIAKQMSVVCVPCVVVIPCECPKCNLTVVRREWKMLMYQMNAAEKLAVYQAILTDIARYDQNLAQVLQTDYMARANGKPPAAANLFFKEWTTYINLYPHEPSLKKWIKYHAIRNTDFARAFFGQAPLIVRSMLT